MNMKRIYVVAILVFISFGVIAQSKTKKHLEFEGVPINGTLYEFLGSLAFEDCTFKSEGENDAWLSIHRGLYKDWDVVIKYIPKSKFVYEVYVESPYQNTWDSLLLSYEIQKKKLIEEYGEPSICVEKFLGDTIFNSDSLKFEYLRDDKCAYWTEFNLPFGDIILQMTSSACIGVNYIDNKNSSKRDFVKLISDLEVIQKPKEVYKLFPTKNIWTFIKLDTRNGKMWQVQYSVGEGDRCEIELNTRKLVYGEDEEVNGRFTLYPTNNIYNFILLDQKEGDVWQVQWSHEKEERLVLRIW